MDQGTETKIHHKIHYSRHYIGMILLAASLLPFGLAKESKSSILLTICFAFYCLGVALISDYIANRLTGRSFLNKILHSGKGRWYYFLIALLGGLTLEGVATYWGGLWYYPFYSLPTYFLIAIIPGGFGWYFLCILLAYEAAKAILDKYIENNRRVTNSYRYERKLYPALLIAGFIGLIIFISKVLINTRFFSKFYLNVTNQKMPYIGFGYVILIFFSLLFILEFMEHARHRTSLIKDVIHGYFNPLVAIILSSLVLGFYMELQNVPIGLWKYTNWPLGGMTIFHLPLTVLFIGWPMHYVFFLSLYRAFGDERSKDIWVRNRI